MKNLILTISVLGGERRLHDQYEYNISQINYILMMAKEKQCSAQKLQCLRRKANSGYIPSGKLKYLIVCLYLVKLVDNSFFFRSPR